MSDSASYELTIDAPAETVFDLLTKRAGLLEWLAVDAQVDLRPGGDISWTHANGQTVVGKYLEIDPPRRLVFTYGWEGNPTVGPGQTTVEIRLSPTSRQGATHLRLTHYDLPADQRESHLHGWRHFLGQLAATAPSQTTDPNRLA